MQRTLTHLGSAALLVWTANVPVQLAQACSVDAGVWAAVMDPTSASAQVPRNGALVVHLTCTVGPFCAGDPLAAVGIIRSPSGNEVDGKWTVHKGDVVVFVPTQPFEVGTNYGVQLKGWRPMEQSFDVVAAIEAPKAEAFEATLELGTTYAGVLGTHTCCTNDSCGSGCYFAKQDELAKLSSRLTRSPSSLPLEQLELRAVSSDSAELVSSCVGCTELPVILDDKPRDKYCVDLSVRALGTGTEVALGQKCTANGRASLARRDTPEAEIPSNCHRAHDARVPKDGGSDVASDANDAPMTDHGDTDVAPAADTRARTDEPSPGDAGSDQTAESEEPSAHSHGCSATTRSDSHAGPLGLLALLAFQGMARRRKRRGPHYTLVLAAVIRRSALAGFWTRSKRTPPKRA